MDAMDSGCGMQRIEYDTRMLENQKLLREDANKRLREQRNQHFKVPNTQRSHSTGLVCMAA